MLLSRRKDTVRGEGSYRVRIMAALAMVELAVCGLFILWPAPDPSDRNNTDFSREEQALHFEELPRTTHATRPAAPPRPQAPVPVPEDEIIEEEFPDIENVPFSDYTDSLSVEAIGQIGDSDEIVSNPGEPASIRHIVEPNTPGALKEAGLQVQVWVEMLVDQNGRVEEASVDEIRVQTGEEAETVTDIGYGLVETSLEAAEQWVFRPAREDGRPVRSRTRQVFSYGY